MLKDALLSVLLVAGAVRGAVLNIPESDVFPRTNGGLEQHEAYDGQSVRNEAFRFEKRQMSSQQMLRNVYNKYAANTLAQLPAGQCTKDNIAVRKEWGHMSRSERLAYIAAVKCLRSQPSQTPPEIDSRPKNRWEDFVVAHFINTPEIHWSGLMFPWHRYFLATLETAMREECGYPGYLPWWDYTKYQDDMTKNPIFDGFDTSTGGYGGSNGCISDGPFVGYQMNMPENASPGQCVTRSNPFDSGFITGTVGPDQLAYLLTAYPDFQSFHAQFESTTGPHTNVHAYIGGTMAGIQYSCQDPSFFFHHAAVDRLWAMYVAQDFANRGNALDPDTDFPAREANNFGPLPPATLDTELYLQPAWPNVTIASIMSPTGGQGGSLCYMYDDWL